MMNPQCFGPDYLTLAASRAMRVGAPLGRHVGCRSAAASAIAELAVRSALAADPVQILAPLAVTEFPSAADRAVRRLVGPIAAAAAFPSDFVGSPARQY